MARRGRRGGRARRTLLQQAVERLKPIASSKLFGYTVEAIIVLIVASAGLALRNIPWYTVGKIVSSPLFNNIDRSLLDYGYLYGNDPWIEYWLSKQLYTHGLSSWFTLTKSNPITHLFWYPWGRDFTHTSYIFIPLFTAATYPLVKGFMSLQQWIALVPPIMSLVMLVAGYIYMRMLFGRIPALLTLPLLYLVPATLDRTHAGFVEKEGVSLGFLIIALIALTLALRRRSVGWAIGSGLLLTLVASMWGGYALGFAALAATAALIPLFVGEAEDTRRLLLVLLVASATGAILSTSLATIGLTKINVRLVAGFTAIIVVFWLVYELSRRLTTLASRVHVLRRLSWKYVYTAILIAIVVIVVVEAGSLGLGGRMFYAMVWPFRAFIKLPPLLESVAEHAPLYMSPGTIREVNVLLFTGPIAGLLLLFYHAGHRGRVEVLPLAVLSLGLTYAVIGMVYFVQSASVFEALATAALLEPLLGGGGQRRGRGEESQLRLVLVIIAAIFFIVVAVYNAYIAYATVSSRIPNILTSNGGFVNPGWLHTLQLLRTTPPDTVVVTWWDYGYWVSVGAGRPTLADGATMNGTQIALLGRMLVSDENTSSRLMRMFGLKPGKTLVLVHDEAIYYNGNMYFLDAIDLPKSYWMVRIGGLNVDDYFAAKVVGGRVLLLPSPAKPGTLHGLLYNMLVDAAYRLGEGEANIITNIKPGPVLTVYLTPPGAATSQDIMPRPKLVHFKPKWIIAYGVPLRAGGAKIIEYVIIAVYEWVG